MQIQLIQGEFRTADSLDIITQMIQVKIRYHENAIAKNSSEEDIKYRESKIKFLQNELADLKKELSQKKEKVNINATISILTGPELS
ncbi:MAG TPA: hypothetical protein VK166_14170 [Chitinophagaceae bacterium]|nr:hypothetical protein [Chitinophagaceae bacterium]